MTTHPLPSGLLAAVAALLLLAAPALAHKVNIFAYVEGQTIYTESYFPDGRPVEEGRILVLDSGRNQLLEGKTDREGLFSFAVPKVDDLTIVIEAGMGHKNQFILTKSALKDQNP